MIFSNNSNANNCPDGQMLVYRTSDLRNPGAGDYEVEQTALSLQNRSPRATIGKERRFKLINEQAVDDTSGIPHEYVKEAAKVRKRKPQMGIVGTAQRFQKEHLELQPPGVGQYNLSSYRSTARAS